jgi:Rrf2 family protein
LTRIIGWESVYPGQFVRVASNQGYSSCLHLRSICVHLRLDLVRFPRAFPANIRVHSRRALLLLGRDNPDKVHQIQELSEAGRIPVKFLEQILLSLRNHGILSSKRGVGGGYTLRRRPSEMTVLEVIELMDGPIAPLPCALDKSSETCSCAEPAFCALRPLMMAAREQLCELFGSKTIQDLVDQARDRSVMVFDI